MSEADSYERTSDCKVSLSQVTLSSVRKMDVFGGTLLCSRVAVAVSATVQRQQGFQDRHPLGSGAVEAIGLTRPSVC